MVGQKGYRHRAHKPESHPVKLTATKPQGQNPLRPTLQTNTIACIPFSGYDYVIVTLMLED